jgi:hypothetical protein
MTTPLDNFFIDTDGNIFVDTGDNEFRFIPGLITMINPTTEDSTQEWATVDSTIEWATEAA